MSRRTSLAYPSGLNVTYGYDGNGRMISMQDSRAGQAVYAVDPDGLLLTEQFPGRLARRYHYDRGLLARFEAVRDGHPVAFAAFTHDPDGRVLSQREHDQAWEYRYDPAGQVVSAAWEYLTALPGAPSGGRPRPGGPRPAPHRDRTELRFAYDAAGNRSSLRHGDAEVRYHYDEADQLRHAESRGRRITYAYDSSGRLTEEIDGERRRIVAYDGFGRPAEVTRTGPGDHDRVKPVFTGDGLLASLTLFDPGPRRDDEDRQALVRYRWGSFGEIPQIINQQAEPDLADAERDHPGRLDADFAYGSGRTFASWDRGSAVFHRDALGSMVRTEDTRPWVHDRAYGPYGHPEGGDADSGSRRPELPGFGYRGELSLWDRVYLRARTYDPVTGRFTTRDPVTSVPQAGQTGNPYAYAGNDPLNMTDPRGQLPVPTPATSDSSGASRDTAAVVAAATNQASKALTDVAQIFTNLFRQHTAQLAFPPGWPGQTSKAWAREFGSPPSCPNSAACGEPVAAFGTKLWTQRGIAIFTELLGLATGGGAFGQLPEAATLLYHYLFGNGAPLILSPGALNSLYQVPSVQTQINRAARQYVPNSVRANIASGQPVSPWDPSIRGRPNTILDNQGFPPRPSWIRALARPGLIDSFSTIFGPLAPIAAALGNHFIPEAPSTNQLDWYLSLAHYDYRIWSGRLNGSTITFQFEVSKYYDQGKPFLNFSTQDFELLVNEGLARNFWISGISNDITIPAN